MKNVLLFTVTFFYSAVAFGQAGQKKDPADFLPAGYVIYEKIIGDLNKDSVPDCVLIIKGTDKSKMVTVENRGESDRNRRGIIILFSKDNQYELAAKNYTCFSSENEDGGAYFPPDLSVEIKKNNLYVHYAHGRYGYWRYTFRYKNADFDLIGYDASSGGVIIDKETSINFLTKRKMERINVNDNAAGGDEVFKTTWKTIKVNGLIKLTAIKDFDELDVSGDE